MHKFTYKFLVGLTSAALIGGSVPVMAEPLFGDEAAETSGTDAAVPGETDNTEDGSEPDGAEEAGPGEDGTSEPGTDETEPGETEPGETEPGETEDGETDPESDGSGEEDPEGESEDPADGDGEEQPKEEAEDPGDSGESGKEDGTKDEEESGQKKDKDKSDSGKESKDKKKDKKSKDSKKKKKSSEKEEAAEEKEERPVLTDAERHPVVPRRTTLYSVRNYTKIKKVLVRCTADEVLIREFANSSSDAEVAAKLSKDAVVRLIDDSDPAWWFIETKDINGKIIRGYADSSCFKKLSKEKAKKAKEDPAKVTAVKLTNAGFGAVEKTTYDELSLDTKISGTRKDLVNYALQFLGNPYLKDGTSLTEGTDCAGFAKAVCAEFGISLPDSLKGQYDTGKKIPVKKAQTGDLIYYINDFGAEEVMICLSNNEKTGKIQVLRVSPETKRIVVTDLNRNVMCRARTFDRLNAESSLPQEEVLDLNEWNWVGESRITSYCYDCNTPAHSAITASGIPATEWHTVAVDSSVIPLGSKVYIEGYGLFIAEDTGVKGKWCDLYVYNHECSLWDMAQVYYL